MTEEKRQQADDFFEELGKTNAEPQQTLRPSVSQVSTYYATHGGERSNIEKQFDLIIDESGKMSHRLASPMIPVELLAKPKLHWRLPLLLYVATCITVTMAGGPIFALCVMTILTFHEFGHYIQTRRYKVRASLPYFIPLPFKSAIFGTMGAIIQMDGRIPDRRALFDIGISGPLAGLVPTLIFCMYGVSHAYVAHIDTTQGGILFGDPLLIQWLSHWIFGPIPPEMELHMGPVGLAGWFGLFLTTLNLFPIGQLDGGHVFYAIIGRRAPVYSNLLFFFIVLYVLFSQNYIWLPMLAILYFLNPRHPPTQNDRSKIGLFRNVLGTATLAFLFVGFTSNPLYEIVPNENQPPPIVRIEKNVVENLFG